ncbi:MAG: helix-turn-helix transcriptional regulator [Clostridiales bacterium]|jgi:transcriptional regulator with XRE-family HTH domain|nr:helix-turn-helix transcriptional regulator [Clostridiales bacterium]
MEFHERLKRKRIQNGLTQKELAQLCNTTPRVIQNYELNERKPGFYAIIALCRALHVSSDYLLGLSEE